MSDRRRSDLRRARQQGSLLLPLPPLLLPPRPERHIGACLEDGVRARDLSEVRRITGEREHERELCAARHYSLLSERTTSLECL